MSGQTDVAGTGVNTRSGASLPQTGGAERDQEEMRRREYYEKPSEIKRRARLRAERRSRRGSTMGQVGL